MRVTRMQWSWLSEWSVTDMKARKEILGVDWLCIDWQAGGGGYEWQVSGQQFLSALPSRPEHPSRDRQPLHLQQPQGELRSTPKSNIVHVYSLSLFNLSVFSYPSQPLRGPSAHPFRKSTLKGFLLIHSKGTKGWFFKTSIYTVFRYVV